MLRYKTFVMNPVQVNCYVLWDTETHDGVIIDCGAWNETEQKRLQEFIEGERINLRHALQTHMHFDHTMGAEFINRQYGLPPTCHPAEQEVYASSAEMVMRWFHMDITNRMPQCQPTLSPSSVITLSSTKIQVIHTPGHTPGGVCFHLPAQRILFSGDTLFRQGIGRTDLPGGSYSQIVNSIRTQLFTLPADTLVLPGHGPETTIAAETGNV
ncbi:MAG: MBL fold metallo-hydrolase [Bacteroidaceae bacterium]|nr:MBL fold metallo-hydrolase [Bacteroidaceae bacterium]